MTSDELRAGDAHEGGSAGIDSLFADDFAEGGEFIGDALVDVFEPEVASPQRHCLRIAAGYKPGLEASNPCKRNSRAVMSTKALGFHHDPLGALRRDRKDVKLTVRENAIHIKEKESDLASAGDWGYFGHRRRF